MSEKPFFYLRVWSCAAVLRAVLGLGTDPRRLARVLISPRLRPFFRIGPEELERLLPYVGHVFGRWPLRPSRGPCLARSVLLYGFLKPGLPDLRLVFGVRRGNAPAKVQGHCWLENAGLTLYDDPGTVAGYERFFTLP